MTSATVSAPEAIKVRRFDDYVQVLENKVILDIDRRKDIIRSTPNSSPLRKGWI